MNIYEIISLHRFLFIMILYEFFILIYSYIVYLTINNKIYLMYISIYQFPFDKGI